MVLTETDCLKIFYRELNSKIKETIGEKRAKRFFKYRNSKTTEDLDLPHILMDIQEVKGKLRLPNEDIMKSTCRNLLEFERVLHQNDYDIEKVRQYLQKEFDSISD